MPTRLKPDENGWRLQDGMYAFLWYEGDQIPKDICYRIRDEDIFAPDIEENEFEEISSDDSENDSD